MFAEEREEQGQVGRVGSVEYASAEPIAALAREAQQAQLGSIDALDTKASALLALDGLILTLLFTSEVARSHWNLMLSIGAGALVRRHPGKERRQRQPRDADRRGPGPGL
jgi:hypothetical protein